MGTIRLLNVAGTCMSDVISTWQEVCASPFFFFSDLSVTVVVPRSLKWAPFCKCQKCCLPHCVSLIESISQAHYLHYTKWELAAVGTVSGLFHYSIHIQLLEKHFWYETLMSCLLERRKLNSRPITRMKKRHPQQASVVVAAVFSKEMWTFKDIIKHTDIKW